MSNWEKYHNLNNFVLPDRSRSAYEGAITAPDVSWRLDQHDQLRILTLGVASSASAAAHLVMWHKDLRPGSMTYDQHIVADLGHKPLVDTLYDYDPPGTVHFAQVDSRELPFPDGYFDVVMTHCLFGCMDWESVQATLAESARVTHYEGVQLHNIRSMRNTFMIAFRNVIAGQILDRIRFGIPYTRRHEQRYEDAFIRNGQNIAEKAYDYQGDTVTYGLVHAGS